MTVQLYTPHTHTLTVTAVAPSDSKVKKHNGVRGKIIHPYVDLDQLYYVLIRIVLYYVLFLYYVLTYPGVGPGDVAALGA